MKFITFNFKLPLQFSLNTSGKIYLVDVLLFCSEHWLGQYENKDTLRKEKNKILFP